MNGLKLLETQPKSKSPTLLGYFCIIFGHRNAATLGDTLGTC